MRRFLCRLGPFAIGAAVFAFLAWAAKPRPEFRIDLPTDLFGSEARFYSLGEGTIDPPDYSRTLRWDRRYMIVGDPKGRPFYVIDCETGVTRGPWGVTDDLAVITLSREGRVICGANDGDDHVGLDPNTGRRVLLNAGGQASEFILLSADAAVLSVVNGYRTGNFVVRFIATADGRTLSELRIPGRRGEMLRTDDRDLAAGGYALSFDGRHFALGEAWHDGRRASDAGIRIYDTATGQILARIADYGMFRPADFEDVPAGVTPNLGGFPLRFTAEGKLRYVAGFRWKNSDSGEDFRTVNTTAELEFDTVSKTTEAAADDPEMGTLDPVRECDWARTTSSADGKLRFWRDCSPDLELGRRAYVADERDVPVSDWVLIPHFLGLQDDSPSMSFFVPGQPGIVLASREVHHPTDGLVYDALRRFLPLASAPTTETVLRYYDWHAGAIRPFRRYLAETGDFESTLAVQPGRAVVLIRGEDKVFVEIWSAPPPANPWSFAFVHAVVVCGVAARLRRREGFRPAAVPVKVEP